MLRCATNQLGRREEGGGGRGNAPEEELRWRGERARFETSCELDPGGAGYRVSLSQAASGIARL